ncbi:MAG: DNA polymerase Y family protein [Myxococcales bacterium FL481]|nr:MAG: DNA polymerase Y family protein [Myxococcales bacterium FL481]
MSQFSRRKEGGQRRWPTACCGRALSGWPYSTWGKTTACRSRNKAAWSPWPSSTKPPWCASPKRGQTLRRSVRWCHCELRSRGGRSASVVSSAPLRCSRTNSAVRGGPIARSCLARTACIDLPAFDLQLLYLRHPAWKKKQLPVAVVTEDRPNGVVLTVNEPAYARRVLPGMRVAAALGLAEHLRVDAVAESDVERGVEEITVALRQFSPNVEPYGGVCGVFWLDGSGLERLYKTPGRWSREIGRAIRKLGYDAKIVVGFARFPTYVIAKGAAVSKVVISSPEEQRALVHKVPLDRLGLHDALRDDLGKLGIFDVGGFLRLPVAALSERFGPEAAELWRLAAGETWDPLQPDPERPSFEQRAIFDHPENDRIRLLFLIKRALSPLLFRLAERGLAVATLFIDFLLDRHDDRHRLDSFRPAEATLDAKTLLQLVHLRLEANPPRAGVIELTVSVEESAAPHEQLQLFAEKPRRNLRAANEAFARIRAEFGDDCIVRPVLNEGHLPEAMFRWEPCERAVAPSPAAVQTPSLVRRVHAKPVRLPPPNRQVRDDGWLLRGVEHGPVVKMIGPHVISGGWWFKTVHREYHFAETKSGEILWVYYDRRRRRWFLHGQVR